VIGEGVIFGWSFVMAAADRADSGKPHLGGAQLGRDGAAGDPRPGTEEERQRWVEAPSS